MKRIRRFILTFIALFIIFPCLTNAATELSASTQNPIVGDSLYVQLEANYGTQLKISDLHLYIDYDPTFFEIAEIKWVKPKREIGTTRSEYGKVYVDKSSGDWNSGPILQLKLNVLKPGSTKINIHETEKAYYTNGNPIAQTMAGIVINSVVPNSNTYLAKLYVKDYNMQPSFKKTLQNYNLIVPTEVSEIEIVAKKYDSTQTVTGAGIKKLNYGINKFKIVVTAQNKESRTYEIVVTRTDNRTGDLSLKTLQVTGTNIKVEANKTEYNATVSRSVDKILISGRTNDPMATLTGTGQKELQIGNNTFELLVQSANGLEQIYKINITRSTEEIEGPVKSSKLKLLTVNSLVLNVSEENTLFLYGISNNIDSLNITPVTESTTATINITGNENLKVGTNKIDIKVTQVLEDAIPPTEEDPEGQEAVIEETTYTLIVYKNPNDATEIDSLEKINGSHNYIYTTVEQNSHIISKDKIKLLVENKKHLYFNIVNMYNGLLYQVKLPTDMEIKDYNLKLTRLDGGDITYSTDLPSNTEITLYLENYESGSSVQVYSYNEGGTYNLITAGLEVKDGYITFSTNGDTHYTLTTRDLIRIENNVDNIISIIKVVLIGLSIGIIAILVIPRLTKKNKEQDYQEPLY